MLEIAYGYDSMRAANCQTAGLMPALDDARQNAWWDYLLHYSIALAGCPPIAAPPAGGILVFGLANTSVIGLPKPDLGRADVQSLIAIYLQNFASQLSPTDGESAEIEAQLWSSAESQLDATVDRALSTCDASSL